MQAALVILAGLTFCVWAYLLLARGFFWRVKSNLWVPPVSSPLADVGKRVTAVIPARNEADTIGNCVTSLLRQSIPDVRVIVVDDGSTDATADAARAAAANLNASARLTVITGQPLPPGWTGKLWAVDQGVQHALNSPPDFLLLTDADIEHGPDTVATLIAISESGPFDLASYMVKLHCSSTAEKFLIPAFVYFFFQLYPPAWIADPRSKTAGAAGGCMLVRPSALARSGGIDAIRSEIIDDCALARAIKSSGGRVWLGLTDSSRSLRAYGTFSEIGRMISRTAFNQLHHSALVLIATILALAVTYLLPIVQLGCGWPTLAGVARVGFSAIGCPTLAGVARVGFSALAFTLMTLSYLPMVRFYRLNPLWALTLPLAAIFYMGATVWSAIQYWSGRGGQWKGRAQDTSRAATP
jgi:hopene-associated glycosyltransferase HpnB